MKKFISILLSLTIFLSAVIPSFAHSVEEWANYWATEESQSGVVVFPGSNENERKFSWYTENESTPKVEIKNENGEIKTFEGYCVKTNTGCFANKVTASGLSAGDYTYKCISGDYTSDSYELFVDSDKSFSALYVTDIHITCEDENEEKRSENALAFDNIIDRANTKADISIILSAGDQASEGLEKEYRGLTASPAARNLSFATTLGNHDRKGVAYKYFKNFPNEKTKGINTSYACGDYWFVKGDVLFMVMESNNASALDHESFMRNAVNSNKNVKWRVVIMHHDLYSGRIPHRESENNYLRLIWGPLFSEFRVDLALLGHSHYYTVSNVVNWNETTSGVKQNDTVNDANGTICVVSGSITRPRTDDTGRNAEVGFAYDDQGSQMLYNVIDFSEDSIYLKSYSYDTDELFNTLTIKKSSQCGGHKSNFKQIFAPFIYTIGTIYQFFNNYSVYKRLVRDGYEVSLFETVFSLDK